MLPSVVHCVIYRLKWISKSQISEKLVIHEVLKWSISTFLYYSRSPSTLGHHVKECVVSNSYLAFLLEVSLFSEGSVLDNIPNLGWPSVQTEIWTVKFGRFM